MNASEQRKHPRVNVDFFADWGWGPECEYYDRVTSLSLSGCFLATKREVTRGNEIYLRWSEEATGTINVKGAVRYQLRVMEGALPTGVGLEFIAISLDAQSKLQKLMNTYQEAISAL